MLDSPAHMSFQHYFREVEPLLRILPMQLYTWLEDIVTENERDLGLIHPVLPNQVELLFIVNVSLSSTHTATAS